MGPCSSALAQVGLSIGSGFAGELLLCGAMVVCTATACVAPYLAALHAICWLVGSRERLVLRRWLAALGPVAGVVVCAAAIGADATTGGRTVLGIATAAIVLVNAAALAWVAYASRPARGVSGSRSS